VEQSEIHSTEYQGYKDTGKGGVRGLVAEMVLFILSTQTDTCCFVSTPANHLF
jgi:hypothetical protein